MSVLRSSKDASRVKCLEDPLFCLSLLPLYGMFLRQHHNMENTDEDEDLKLARASAGLLDDLQAAIPRLLWKANKHDGTTPRRVHSRVKQRDLDYVIKLVRAD